MIWSACTRYRAQLVDFTEGTLRPEVQARIAAHLHGCSECREAVAALQEMPTLLRTADIPDPGDLFWHQQRRSIARAIRNQRAPVARRFAPLDLQLSRWRVPLAVAASAVLAFGVYRYTARAPEPLPPAFDFASLDVPAITAIHDVVQVLAPPDGLLADAAAPEDVPIDVAPAAEIVGTEALPDNLPLSELSDTELDDLDAMVGNIS